jgi:hypothetical protein
MSRRKAMAVWVAIVCLTLGVGLATATNRNGCWKYADFAINWYNGGTDDYYNIFQEEAKTDADAWDPYTDVSFTQVAAAGTTDHLHGYSGFYGATGWLVLSEISSYSGCTIKSGRFRFNRTYLDSASYSRAQKEALACNNIGKLLGLSRDTTNKGCMNDTIVAPYPSTHDQSLVNSIY